MTENSKMTKQWLKKKRYTLALSAQAVDKMGQS